MNGINLIEKKIYTDGEAYYFNTETKEKYGEIAGGLAWPANQEGFLVIASVDLFENTELDTRHIRVLSVVSESKTDVFLKRALELQRQFSPFMGTIKFYGDTTFPEMMEFLDQFNRERRSRRLDPFYLTEAPEVKSPRKLEFYAQLVRRYTHPGRRILHFCDTALPGYLVSISPDELTRSVLDHPPVAALGYALGALSRWKPRKGEKKQEKVETETKGKQEDFVTGNGVEETICECTGSSELSE